MSTEEISEDSAVDEASTKLNGVGATSKGLTERENQLTEEKNSEDCFVDYDDNRESTCLVLINQTVCNGPLLKFLTRSHESNISPVLQGRIHHQGGILPGSVVFGGDALDDTQGSNTWITEVYYGISLLENYVDTSNRPYLVSMYVRRPSTGDDVNTSLYSTGSQDDVDSDDSTDKVYDCMYKRIARSKPPISARYLTYFLAKSCIRNRENWRRKQKPEVSGVCMMGMGERYRKSRRSTAIFMDVTWDINHVPSWRSFFGHTGNGWPLLPSTASFMMYTIDEDISLRDVPKGTRIYRLYFNDDSEMATSDHTTPVTCRPSSVFHVQTTRNYVHDIIERSRPVILSAYQKVEYNPEQDDITAELTLKHMNAVASICRLLDGPEEGTAVELEKRAMSIEASCFGALVLGILQTADDSESSILCSLGAAYFPHNAAMRRAQPHRTVEWIPWRETENGKNYYRREMDGHLETENDEEPRREANRLTDNGGGISDEADRQLNETNGLPDDGDEQQNEANRHVNVANRLPDDGDQQPDEANRHVNVANRLADDGDEQPGEANRELNETNRLPDDGDEQPDEANRHVNVANRLADDGDEQPDEANRQLNETNGLPDDGDEQPDEANRHVNETNRLPDDGDQQPSEANRHVNETNRLPEDGDEQPDEANRHVNVANGLPDDGEEQPDEFNRHVNEANVFPDDGDEQQNEANRQLNETNRLPDDGDEQTDDANRQVNEANRLSDDGDEQPDEANRQVNEANRLPDDGDEQPDEANRQVNEANRLPDDGDEQPDEANRHINEANGFPDDGDKQPDEANRHVNEANGFPDDGDEHPDEANRHVNEANRLPDDGDEHSDEANRLRDEVQSDNVTRHPDEVNGDPDERDAHPDDEHPDEANGYVDEANGYVDEANLHRDEVGGHPDERDILSDQTDGHPNKANGYPEEENGHTDQANEHQDKIDGHPGEREGQADETNWNPHETYGYPGEADGYLETDAHPTERDGHPHETSGQMDDGKEHPGDVNVHPIKIDGQQADSTNSYGYIDEEDKQLEIGDDPQTNTDDKDGLEACYEKPQAVEGHPNKEKLYSEERVVLSNEASLHPNETDVHGNDENILTDDTDVHSNEEDVYPNEEDRLPNETYLHPYEEDVRPKEAAMRPNDANVFPTETAGQMNEAEAHPNKTEVHLCQAEVHPCKAEVHLKETESYLSEKELHSMGIEVKAKEADDHQAETRVHENKAQESDQNPKDPNRTPGGSRVLKIKKLFGRGKNRKEPRKSNSTCEDHKYLLGYTDRSLSTEDIDKVQQDTSLPNGAGPETHLTDSTQKQKRNMTELTGKYGKRRLSWIMRLFHGDGDTD